MMAMQLSEAARVLDGQLAGGDVAFTGISTDTRTLPAGALFFALQGPNFDGHAYVEVAGERGAAAAAVSQPCTTALPYITVDNTRLALGRLAADWRRRFTLPVIGITGSNGKTTVRAMTAAILARRGRTLATRGNLNNDIGLPLTLARLDADDRFAIIEMGANHAGEIDYLAGLAKPTIAVVTNAGPAHLEGFGDITGVAHAKGELFTRLDSDGVAVINADDDYAPLWRELAAHCQRIEFGLAADCAVSADWHGDADGSDITLYTPQGEARFRLPLPGKHNVMNALAATAAAQAAGADLDDISAALATLAPVGGRFNVHHLPGQITLIDDTYNANPASLQAALDVLNLSGGKSWLVLGDMGELGKTTAALHASAGRSARVAGVDRVFTLGELAAAAAEAFGEQASSFSSQQALIEALQQDLRGPLHILVKGSRRMRMEHVVEALLSAGGA